MYVSKCLLLGPSAVPGIRVQTTTDGGAEQRWPEQPDTRAGVLTHYVMADLHTVHTVHSLE